MRHVALAVLLLAACSGQAPKDQATAPTEKTAVPASPAAAAPAAPTAPAVPPPTAAAVKIEDKSGLIEFAYGWPAAAAAIPALDARLRADARTSRQRTLNGAREDKVARPADAPWHPHAMQKTWTVEGEAAGLLALRDQFYTFTGGAHGMSGFEAILWDRAAGDDIAVWSLFRDRQTAVAALTTLYCPLLDRERAEKRGGPTAPGAGSDWMTACPDIAKQIVVPSDVRDGRFTAFRVLIGPYEAGPYAEGSYEVVVPVTAALVGMLKAERRDVLGVP